MVIHHLVILEKKLFLVVLERGQYLFPFRTQKSSLSSLMVLHRGRCGRVRRCQDCNYIYLLKRVSKDTLFIFYPPKNENKKAAVINCGFFIIMQNYLLP